MKNKILVVAAHPDDEILGCGGTVARMIEEGSEAVTVILGEGLTSRDRQRDSDNRKEELLELKRQIADANRIIGINQIYSFDFPDNRFDTVPLLDIVKVVEDIKREFRPDVVFTHLADDLNIDHFITNKAVLTATRPMPGETVKELYAFEVLSSTEWNFPLSFLPDYFVRINDTIERKIQAMEIYQSELRDYPHPRSIKAIKLNAEYWGMRTGLGLAESFKTLRKSWN